MRTSDHVDRLEVEVEERRRSLQNLRDKLAIMEAAGKSEACQECVDLDGYTDKEQL
jgi:hypothetical protein